MMKKIYQACIVALSVAVTPEIMAQQPVSVGKGSYAAYPPPYKGQTDEHQGFQASKMLTRKIYADETDASGNPRPIPTNDWWTDLLNNQFSGAMWSYPAMLTTAPAGMTVAYPSYWYENGTEVKSRSNLTVGGKKFTAAEARAADWHDWDVVVSMPAVSGGGEIKATLVHGIPFTWFEFDKIVPELTFSESPVTLRKERWGTLILLGTDIYGLYYPEGTEVSIAQGAMTLQGAEWLSVGLLTSDADFDSFAPYACSIVRSTTVNWHYEQASAMLVTEWDVKAENLRNPSEEAPVMQGFLPHAYKHAVSQPTRYLPFDYLTPRGKMKITTAADGHFSFSYRFPGMLPYYAAPAGGEGASAGYDQATMNSLISAYANGGGFGGDTYWGGKGLTQMALNMTFAKETGETELYNLSKSKLRGALENWLTYTPGEERMFFSYYPRWGGMLGFDVSYDSDAFNDHHFHYGYFIYASALLCLEDESFARDYGEILRMIVKDYANYDRADTRFPFMRTLDPWAGHSYAGGLGDHGNDNGNGQESSSEAMQGWGGVYLLGVALGDRQMRDAGIFGWLTESRGTVEYWFDRDQIHPEKEHNYDYTLYQSPYNTNLTSKGIGWWTWFSGDPLWMHSIQWMPVSPCLNYLSEDLEFVKWDYEKMRDATAYAWFSSNGNEAPLADQSVGNVVLCYMERYDPEGAAEVFDSALEKGMGIARGIDTGHISYYVIHSHLTYGDIDFNVYADYPTANAYRRSDGSMTYMVYVPTPGVRRVNFYRDGVLERAVDAPGGKLTVFTDMPAASSVVITPQDGVILPPGETARFAAALHDQYGVEMEHKGFRWSLSGDGAAGGSISEDGLLTINTSAVRGSHIAVTAESDNISASVVVTVNDAPRTVSAKIAGVPDFIETGTRCDFQLEVTDQYGTIKAIDAAWTVVSSDGDVPDSDNGSVLFEKAGVYTIHAVGGQTEASARLTVLPPLANVVGSSTTASSSSEENAGTLTANAIDGDPSTRWGSAHSDDQWLMLDLQNDFRIASVTIDWEAAYAADYDIEVAADGVDITDDSVWTTAFSQRGLSGAGIVRHSVAATGRYVRVKCLRRGSAYGYSIKEIEVGGVEVGQNPATPVGLDISIPAVIQEGELTPVSARGFNFNGEVVPLEGIVWGSEPDGQFVDGGFIPLTYGIYTVMARCGKLSATRQLLVEESVKLHSLTASPSRMSLLTGDTGYIILEGQDQFGGVYPLSLETVSFTVTDENGNEMTVPEVCFDINTGAFQASRRGDYVIDFDGKASVEISVRDVAEANLAAGKSARASSSQGGNIADNVTDLDLSSRWESRQADDEWLVIDLETPFVLERGVIHWEGAYASSYAVQTSLDGEKWFTVYSTTAGKGGVESFALPSVPASQVRILCRKRATVWANSIYEVELYGSRRFDETDDGSSPEIVSVDYTTGNGSVEGRVAVSHPRGLVVFTEVKLLDNNGTEVGGSDGTGNKTEFIFSGLRSGVYNLAVCAVDAFGNEATRREEVEVTFTSRGLNLALGKFAEATSSENEANLGAEKAVDGDIATRWGSRFNDDEALTVDLADIYLVDQVHIYWNQPAFATHYSVELSINGVDFTPVARREEWNGATDLCSFAAVPARYVKVTGHRRATPYGSSVNELEVYGDDYTASGVTAGAEPMDDNSWVYGRIDVLTADGRYIMSLPEEGSVGGYRPGYDSGHALADRLEGLLPAAGVYIVTDGGANTVKYISR